ncbi:AaceriABL191Wp [[Ashbya] aceris (nom. inval.)]|nr:AaceriABL191Wp [[Ashbya] aceris (nom. inval.)]
MELIQKVSQGLWELENCDTVNNVVVLGKEYPSVPEQRQEERHENGMNMFQQIFTRPGRWNEEFLADVHTRLHFTYRTRFVPIPRHPDGPSPMSISVMLRDNPLNVIENVLNNPDCFQTDIGWGCMIRTGQSLLANALQRTCLGRDFRIDDSSADERELRIIKWFEDDPKYPFSLHKFVQEGFSLSGKKPGEWFGPSATSRSIQALVAKFPACGIAHCVISTDSGDVYMDEVEPLFQRDAGAAVLLLLCVRLGVDVVNEVYWEHIRHILSSEHSVGIAGGRPSSSLYFFGYQDEHLFYLDPHKPQLNLASYQHDLDLFRSVHSQRFNKVHMSDIDPSMLIGILLNGKDDWHLWQQHIAGSQIIHLSDSKPVDLMLDHQLESAILGDRYLSEDGQGPSSKVDTGDYIDVGSFVPCTDSCKNNEFDDEYQDVKCKNQRIVVVGETSSNGSPEVEVEKVLVEKETIPVRSK